MKSDIIQLRSKIDGLDNKIMQLIVDRVTVARTIIEQKKSEGIPVKDGVRETEIVDRLARLYPSIDRVWIEGVYQNIFRMVYGVGE